MLGPVNHLLPYLEDELAADPRYSSIKSKSRLSELYQFPDQGTHYYRGKNPEDAIGQMQWEIGLYKPEDLMVDAAFDIDKRKAGKHVHEAIFAEPN